jgi:hypothetical protein
LAILGAGGIMLSIVPLPSTINSLVSEWMHSFVVKVGGGLVVLTGILTGTIPIIAIPKKIKKSNKKILDFALDSSRYENIEYFAKLLDPGKAICVKETTPAVYYVIKKECIETHKTNPLDKNQTNLEFLNLEEIKSLPKKKS